MEIRGKVVDVKEKRIFPGKIVVEKRKIIRIIRENKVPDKYILPGFVDAHVHIESSMLTPVRFAELAIRQGTVAAVTDPHEIANVLGIEGIKFMQKEAERTTMKIKFGIPSCVPATPYETSGGVITAREIEALMREDPSLHLAEMMNYPGVIFGDKEVHKKLAVAKKYGRIIDGHAPGLRGKELEKYIQAGIHTDHECSDIEEAREKIRKGMKILIREGSAAKNYEELVPLVGEYPEEVMFCTDDSHPDELAERHIRDLVKRSVAKGYDLWSVLKAAAVNPVKFYKIDAGLLQEGDPADFIIVEDLKDFKLEEVYIEGERIYDGKNVFAGKPGKKCPNRFVADPIREEEIQIKTRKNKKIRVITAQDGSLVTGEIITELTEEDGKVVGDPNKDLLKIVVVNRYEKDKRPVCGIVKGFGFKKGAIAGSIAHDSHNIIAVGVADREITAVVNAIIGKRGGIAVTDGEETEILQLPVAGLMTHERGKEIAEMYKKLNKKAKHLGTALKAPFMTLSFMALLVIPELKIGDKGLFDVKRFRFAEMFI
jgi:adenine deaminase